MFGAHRMNLSGRIGFGVQGEDNECVASNFSIPYNLDMK